MHLDALVLSLPVRLGLEGGVAQGSPLMSPAHKRKSHELESGCSVQEVGQVEVNDVVTSEDVRVHRSDQRRPVHQHLTLVLVAAQLG